MKFFPRTLGVALLFGLTGLSVHAGPSLGVNFTDNVNGDTIVGPAGLVPQNNWQNISVSSSPVGGIALFDSAGTAAGTLNFSGNLLPSNQNPNFISGGDEILMNAYVAAFSTPMTFTITGVPYAAYDLIVYTFPVNNKVTFSATVGGASYFGTSLNAGQTGPGYIDNNNLTPFNFTRAVGTTSDTATLNANYFEFTGLTGGKLTFSVNDLTNGIPAVNGFQIVQAPEPGSALLLLTSLGALGLRRTRHQA